MQIVVTAFTSLDGVVQAPGGPDEDRDGGFAHGGWSMRHFDPGGGGWGARRWPAPSPTPTSSTSTA